MRRAVAFLLTLTVLLFSLTACSMVVDNQKMKVIAVIAKGEDTPYFNAVLAGAEDAAIENGYQITFRGPESKGSEAVREQRAMLKLAIENDAVAVVFEAAGEGFCDLLRELHELDKPVIQMGTGVDIRDMERLKKDKQSPVIASVYTHNKKIAATAAEHLYEDIKEEIANGMMPYKIGIIQHDPTANGEDRKDGFMKRFRELAEEDPSTAGKYVFLVESCAGARNNSYGRAMERLQKRGVRSVFMTDENVVNQVWDMIEETGSKYDYIKFVGFDSGKKQVDWLRSEDGPELIGAVTQDPYAIGYNAIVQCINAMETKGVTAFVAVPGAWYDVDNLDYMIARSLITES